MIKTVYNLLYRINKAPWDSGPRKDLVSLIESGKVTPGKAIDSGSGTGSNSIFLAKNGFEVTGLDFAESAIKKAKKKAQEEDVKVNFFVDNLTNLQNINGEKFDFLIDWGTFDDLTPSDRDQYIRNVLPLTHPGSKFLFFCFEWPSR